MLGHQFSRQLSVRLDTIDQQLLELVEHLGESERPADEVLHELLPLTAEFEGLVINPVFHFGTPHTYATIVDDRLGSLEGARFLKRQTTGEFMVRRCVPAMNFFPAQLYCSASTVRDLTPRVTRRCTYLSVIG
ncbi:DUF3422 family protein [Austwickia chelonae]|uniref:DUF3422 family protein n=1 Tax=Austwickia chelonae TaxID=100225 RepID=UPI000307B9A6